MIKQKNILAALLTGLLLATAPALAEDAAPAAAAPAAAATTAAPAAAATTTAEAAATVIEGEPEIELQPWAFSGIFGRYDENQLRRGFQVFKEVCSSCHSANLLSFRNLSEEGGPAYSDAQVKALAATYTIADPDAQGGKRPALPADRWPAPFPTEKDARDANGGALPPDWSVLAKARGAERPLLSWARDIVMGYQEGGPDYVHALMNGYHAKPPAGFSLPEGKYYNDYFPGHSIGMPPPLSDGLVKYTTPEGGTPTPETVDQYSRDVSAFMMWLAEPGLNSRKESGFRVLLFLVLFAVVMWLVKRRIWSNVEGH